MKRYVVDVLVGIDYTDGNEYHIYEHHWFDSVLLATRFANKTEGATKVIDTQNLPF